jgi:hypothetical protein
MVILYNCCTMHNSTHSVHKHLLKVWRARLLCFWPSLYVSSPPLSEANCQPFPPPGGPGPPASKMAPFSPGFTHTPSPPSFTVQSEALIQPPPPLAPRILAALGLVYVPCYLAGCHLTLAQL